MAFVYFIPFTEDVLKIGTAELIITIIVLKLYNAVMHPIDADRMANSVDPDQTAPLWVCTVLLRSVCLST